MHGGKGGLSHMGIRPRQEQGEGDGGQFLGLIHNGWLRARNVVIFVDHIVRCRTQGLSAVGCVVESWTPVILQGSKASKNSQPGPSVFGSVKMSATHKIHHPFLTKQADF